jgi:hypothetical protein
MDNSNRRLIIIIIIIAVVGCLCICIAGTTGMGFFFWNLVKPVDQVIVTEQVYEGLEEGIDPTITPIPPEITPNSTPIEESTADVLPSLTQQATEQSPNASLPAEVAGQMYEIELQVSEIRGLQSNGPVTRQLLTREQLRQHVIDDFLKDYSEEEATDDAIFLSAIGLLEPDFDLYNFYLDLYTEQIAGYYDDETDEMFVVQGSGFNGPEKLTYAHEFVHALQDISYGTETGLGCDDDAWEEDSERCAAYQALVEGDASYLETLWFSENATPEDVEQIQEFYNSYTSPIFDSAPAFMREDFLFPYISGQPFVQNLHSQGGWQAVDEAFKNPPVSTEQILHSEKYPDDLPVQVEIPDLTPVLGEGWREIDRGTMGEWSTYLILAHGLDPQAQLDTTTAKNASAGWGGDAYVVYFNDQDQATVVVLSSTWDSEGDAVEFSEAFSEYASARFGSSVDEKAGLTTWESSSDYTTLSQEDDNTIWISAPTSEIEQSIRDAINQQ